MCIKNNTKGTLVADHARLADNFWRRLKGLLGTNSLPDRHGLIIKPCSSVHTFGMRYSIDVLFMDGNHCIIKIVENMPPGKGSMAAGSKYVIELPAGTARETACSVGDRLELL